MFDSIHPNTAHHAYAVEGAPEKVREELWKFFEKEWGVAVRGNPDFSYRKFERVGVDEAQELKGFQENKSFAAGGKKIFVIEADTMTLQAQNSLLKMFEEPAPHTHFFLMGGCVKNLIPTLASRFSHVRIDVAPPSAAEGGAREFLKAPLPKRLALVKKLADDIKDEKKSRGDALGLLHDIERLLYEKTQAGGKPPEKFFESLELCREYMRDPSASVKMLLEYVALVTPVGIKS